MYNQHIHLDVFKEAGLEVSIKREDQIHPVVSGNKYRKLKYNILEVKQRHHAGVLTFGGAFSNHIAATAFACREAGIPCVGIIRGEELKDRPLNTTLSGAVEQGMHLDFVSREQYREKMGDAMIKEWEQRYPGYFILPEGGSNTLAVKGCSEILEEADRVYDVVCTPTGTGGTMAGLIMGSHPGQKILGFPALKGDFVKDEIAKFVASGNWSLETRFHFGGYARVNTTLIEFINTFKKETGIPLDPVYTGKMMYGLCELAKEGYFKPGTRILAVHTGGLQGIKGMNQHLKQKKLPLIL